MGIAVKLSVGATGGSPGGVVPSSDTLEVEDEGVRAWDSGCGLGADWRDFCEGAGNRIGGSLAELLLNGESASDVRNGSEPSSENLERVRVIDGLMTESRMESANRFLRPEPARCDKVVLRKLKGRLGGELG